MYEGAKFKCFFSVLSSLPMLFSYLTFTWLTRVYIKRERDFGQKKKALSFGVLKGNKE